MDIKALRETELYDKHFDVIEPEAHAVVSVQFTIEVLQGLLTAEKRDNRYLHDLAIEKVNELKQLIS